MKALVIGEEGQAVTDAQYLLRGNNRYQIEAYHGKLDGIYGKQTAAATKQMKYLIGYATTSINGTFGEDLFGFLVSKTNPRHKLRSPAMRMRAAKRAAEHRKKHYYPLAHKGSLIGWPGIGTHSWKQPPNNWESDNAVDIETPVGTPVIAYADGQIGAQIGPLPDSDPRFAGNRLHLHTDGNEFYYAHLSKLNVHAHQTVKAGDTLGYSGIANGVPHLHWACVSGNPVNLLRGL